MKEKNMFKMKRKIAILLIAFFPSLLFAQTNAVSGTITENGESLIGVSVLEKGTTNGTVSDIDGNFKIELTKSPATLVFSMIGMTAQEKTVSAGDNINVVLSEDATQLSEVIVTGYTSQRKADLTGAVAVVDVSDMMKSAENNPMKALQGRVAGMDISANGNPSGAATIRIRGIGTLNNNDPLYIIDGVPTKGGMHELNSNDIESIQVLKDASAASIYGSRAANGVILITTKRGKKGAVKIDFDAYLTATYYTTHLDVMNAKEYGQAMWQANVNSGSDPNANNIGYNFDWSYDANGTPVLNNVYLPKYLDAAKTMYSANTDWFDEVSRTGFMQSYNVSASSGTEKGNSYFSLGYFKNDGTLKNTDFNRISARMNTDYKLLGDRLTVGENFTLNRTSEVNYADNVLDLALKALPIVPVHTIDGEGWGGPANGMNDRDNPVRLLNANKDNRYNYWRLLGNVFADLEPVKDLHFRTNFGIDYANYYKRSLGHTYQAGFLNNINSSVNLEQGHWSKWNWSNIAAYRKTIDRHNFDLMAGMEMFRQQDINFNAYTMGENAFTVETPEYMWPDVSTGKAQVGGGQSGYSLLSFFGKANYVYDNRYLLSATVRRDGSSRFGKNKRFGTFPAFSAGWRISEEDFMNSASAVVSDLKLRAGWGQTGNQEIGNYATYTIYTPDYGIADPTWGIVRGTAYDLTGNSGSLPAGYRKIQSGNDDLKWETTTQTNVGVDFALWKNTLYGSVEYYLKDTRDILLCPAYLGAVGEGGDRWANGASMENKGWEFLLGYRNKTAFGLNYDVTATMSGFRNKVTKLPVEVENSYGGRAGDNILGHPLNSFYGYVADGLFRTQEEVDAHVAQEGKGVGRIRYKNVYEEDGLNTITEMDKTWIGSPYPDFAYGLNVNLEYKGFDMLLFFYGVQGVDISNPLKWQTDFWSLDDINSNKGRRALNAFHPVTNPDSDIPMLQAQNVNDEGRSSTYFIEDGSFLKLRNVQLGYSLPSLLLSKVKLEKVRFYIAGQNLFTVHSKSFTGVDPENAGVGYPIPMTCTLGVNVTF
jgi:TonB-linked SusC/RagA family outer membrane protein